jgi:hypothetical protein
MGRMLLSILMGLMVSMDSICNFLWLGGVGSKARAEMVPPQARAMGAGAISPQQLVEAGECLELLTSPTTGMHEKQGWGGRLS